MITHTTHHTTQDGRKGSGDVASLSLSLSLSLFLSSHLIQVEHDVHKHGSVTDLRTRAKKKNKERI